MKGLNFLHSRRFNPLMLTEESCQINVISYSVWPFVFLCSAVDIGVRLILWDRSFTLQIQQLR